MQRAGKVKRRHPKMFYKLCHRACIHDYYYTENCWKFANINNVSYHKLVHRDT